ncbi:hypothetical protein C8F01DRAFT_1274529 [Mycena amicta]|nr:hypothetical protein C8F01DRAFT_1274529 [Mycena amicta]
MAQPAPAPTLTDVAPAQPEPNMSREEFGKWLLLLGALILAFAPISFAAEYYGAQGYLLVVRLFFTLSAPVIMNPKNKLLHADSSLLLWAFLMIDVLSGIIALKAGPKESGPLAGSPSPVEYLITTLLAGTSGILSFHFLSAAANGTVASVSYFPKFGKSHKRGMINLALRIIPTAFVLLPVVFVPTTSITPYLCLVTRLTVIYTIPLFDRGERMARTTFRVLDVLLGAGAVWLAFYEQLGHIPVVDDDKDFGGCLGMSCAGSVACWFLLGMIRTPGGVCDREAGYGRTRARGRGRRAAASAYPYVIP